MLQSMTGFGQAEKILNHKKYTIEIRSLNSKSLDVSIRLPKPYRSLEMIIRQRMADTVIRGKIDFSLMTEDFSAQFSSPLNEELLTFYMQKLQKFAPQANPIELLSLAMRMPDVLETQGEEISEEEKNMIIEMVDSAIIDLTHFREHEGVILQTEFEKRINLIKDKLENISLYEGERISEIRGKMLKSLEEKELQIDANRYEQEIIYYTEKLDITEEKVRLKKHCDYFLDQLNQNESNGRKLNFISQEIGREINTLGAKANHEKMQRLVIEMKDELEKIKEQILNIL